MESNQYKDANGHLWTCEITFDEAKRLRDECEVNLLELLDKNAALLQRLYTDLYLFVDCLYLTVGNQHDIEVQEFNRGLRGEFLAAAHKAWIEGVTLFFQSPKQQEVIRAMIAKAETIGGLLAEKATAELEAIDVESVVEKLKNSSGSTEELSDSQTSESSGSCHLENST